MSRERDQWIDVFRALGESFLSVLQAELGVMGERLRGASKRLAGAALFSGFALALAFSMTLLLVLASFDFLRVITGWHLWQVALALALVLLVLIAVLGTGAWLLVRRLQNPVEVLKGQYQEHVEWWNSNLIAVDRDLAAGEPSEGEDGEQAKQSHDSTSG